MPLVQPKEQEVYSVEAAPLDQQCLMFHLVLVAAQHKQAIGSG